MKTLKDFIFIQDNALDFKECENICRWFDLNIDKSNQGLLMSNNKDDELDINKRKCLDIHIPNKISETKQLNQILDNVFFKHIERYKEINDFSSSIAQSNFKIINDGYLLTLYDEKSYFKLHTDDCVCSIEINNKKVKRRRIIAGLLYLNNTLGGETYFLTCNLKIIPKSGKLVIFPANWMFPHEGLVPKSKKYIISTFFYSG
jgi:hypothetical protein